MKILITGCAGFIGYHLAENLLSKGNEIYGIDNLNSYYDIKLKKKRLSFLKKKKKFFFKKIDLSNFKELEKIFKFKFDLIINLAAQAGVRYSLYFPDTYIETNIKGFYNLLELAKKYKIKKMMYASSSSVYGSNKNKSFSENHLTENQISLYAVTKKTNEILANYYSKSFKIKMIGLRFFTIYGPWGRPDMAIFSFAKAIKNKKSIYLNNFGKHSRDFTYIDDCVVSIVKLIPILKNKTRMHEIINIAGGRKVKLKKLVSLIERNLNLKAKIKFRKLQFGDVPDTKANNNRLRKLTGFYPRIGIEEGLKYFFKWFINYSN